MSRLRVRDPNNTRWLDICQSEWRVRNPSNTGWVRMMPSQGMKARHGSNDYWLDIDCVADSGTADCEADEYGGTHDGKGENGSGPAVPAPGTGGGTDGGGGGTPDGGGGTGDQGGTPSLNGPESPIYTNPDLGSGNGSDEWMEDAPYPPGFDLPDSGGDGAGDTGECIARPGLNTCEPKLPPETRPDTECGNGASMGSFDCPLECPDSVNGSGSGITEFYVNMGDAAGNVRMPWQTSAGAISVDIYYRGKRVATTNGQRRGVDALAFVYTPVGDENKIFVRVRSTMNDTRWAVQIKCPGEDDADGTLDNPRPCKGTYEVRREGGTGVYEFYHEMGDASGEVDVHYQMWNQPDKLEVFHNGARVGTTGTFVAGEGHVKFNYSPAGDNTLVLVRITAQDAGTSWIYLISCPGDKGTEDNPRPCSDSEAVFSGGAGVTDTFVDFGPTAGEVGIRYQMWEIPDKLDVFQNGTLVATTGAPVTGDHWLYFDYDPELGTKIQIRVTGEGKTTWSFLHTCPDDGSLAISVDDPSELEGKPGDTNQMCWTVSLDKPQKAEVSVDYATTGGTANAVVAQAVILASDQANNPFIAVVDQEGVGKAAFDGGWPKFYNSNFQEPQPAPTGAQVFDTWYRTANAEYYTDPTTIPAASEASKWVMGTTGVQCTVNSAGLVSFLSPNLYDSYTFEATLSSADGDDDMIGCVVAFLRIEEANHLIVACRQKAGMPQFGTGNFSLVYIVNQAVVSILAAKDVGSSAGGWSGAQTRVKVERDCNTLKVSCSPFGSLEYSLDTIEIDLNALSPNGTALTAFKEPTRWGFCAFSQMGATFSDVALSGIGLPPAFTYAKNLAKWAMKPDSTHALLLGDSINFGYNLEVGASNFGVGIVRSIEEAGFTVDKAYLEDYGRVLTAEDLAPYGLLFVISHATDGVQRLGGSSALVVAEWVKQGGGLIVTTDHNVFQLTANTLASPFNVEFFGSVDRGPTPVADMIAMYGDHPVWEGLQCKDLTNGGSEGAIRIREVISHYTPTQGTLVFAPGEMSKQVCVDLLPNEIQEPDRTVELTLSNPTKGDLPKPIGVGTILDDDTPLCNQDPQGPVYGTTQYYGPGPGAGFDGAEHLFVQEVYLCAAANTHYLMMRDLDFAETGPYVWDIHRDDEFELYIDCKKVAEGGLGRSQFTLNIAAGTRNIIVRYKNVPDCTPGFVGFVIRYNNAVVYKTTAAGWKGQANAIGEIIG